MSNSLPFQFAVLRYYHDPVTQEFLNIGLVLYSPEAQYLKSMINKRYGRISKTFNGINHSHYSRMVKAVEYGIERYRSKLASKSLFDNYPDSIEDLLPLILKPDDSSIRFGGYGGGLVNDLDSELDRLFERLVERYEPREKSDGRRDEEIWHNYSKLFAELKITEHLEEVKIGTPNYQYVFPHAFKNERWHPIEPISFDLANQSYILEKANKWIGRGIMLADSSELGTLYLLLGAPSAPELQEAYNMAAINLKTKIKGIDVEVVREEKSEEFAVRFANFVKSHVGEGNK